MGHGPCPLRECTKCQLTDLGESKPNKNKQRKIKYLIQAQERTAQDPRGKEEKVESTAASSTHKGFLYLQYNSNGRFVFRAQSDVCSSVLLWNERDTLRVWAPDESLSAVSLVNRETTLSNKESLQVASGRRESRKRETSRARPNRARGRTMR